MRRPLGFTHAWPDGESGPLEAWKGDLLWTPEHGYYVYTQDKYRGDPCPVRRATVGEILFRPRMAWRARHNLPLHHSDESSASPENSKP